MNTRVWYEVALHLLKTPDGFRDAIVRFKSDTNRPINDNTWKLELSRKGYQRLRIERCVMHTSLALSIVSFVDPSSNIVPTHLVNRASGVDGKRDSAMW